jgi:hypothetical protein
VVWARAFSITLEETPAWCRWVLVPIARFLLLDAPGRRDALLHQRSIVAMQAPSFVERRRRIGTEHRALLSARDAILVLWGFWLSARRYVSDSLPIPAHIG